LSPTALLAAAPDANLVGLLMWNAIVGVIVLVAVVRVVAVPTASWPRRRWSKAGWIIAALWISWHVGGLVLPIVAVAGLAHARTLAERDQAPPPMPDLLFPASTPWTEAPPTNKDDSERQEASHGEEQA
jgi:hypothetical protein